MEGELIQRIGGRDDLADLQPYRAPQIEAAVRLNTNESPYPPPDEFLRELAEAVASAELHRYPDRDALAAREVLAAHAGTLTERVWLANGSNELILQLLLAFGGAERKAMTFEPTYGMHSHITRVSGTRLLRGRRNPDFTLHLEATVEAVVSQQPDIVFLCSPNNPTGNIDRAEGVGEICGAASGIVILDEAYAEFSGSSLLNLVEDYDHLIVTRSFSKAWRLAGARVGYMVAKPWVLEEVLKVRLPYHLSTLAQLAVTTAVRHTGELMATVDTLRHERDRVFGELTTTRGITAFESQANFILFRVDDRPATEVWQGLQDRGILIRDFSDVAGCEECLRVSIGTPEENEKFLEALPEVLAS